jgi:pimeloyl-ACP methyl ester carboxylesterase
MIIFIIVLIVLIILAYGYELTTFDNNLLRASDRTLLTMEQNGSIMTYLDRGEGHKIIVLVHGYSSCYRCWDELSAYYLSRGYRVIIPELFGNGYSDKKQDFSYSIDFYSEQVRAFIEELGLKNFHLLGHSMGGAIAVKVASQLKSKVESLVLIAPAGFGPLGNSNVLTRLQVFWPVIRLFFFLRFYPVVVFSLRLVALNFRVKKPKDYFEHFNRVINSKGYTRMFFTIAKSINTSQWDVRKEAGKIDAPTLLLHGNKDRIVTWKGSFILHSLIKKSTVEIIENGAHSVMETHPFETEKALTRFYDEHQIVYKKRKVTDKSNRAYFRITE